MKITCVVGLPGSGKTCFANSLTGVNKIVDDPHDLSQLPNPEDLAKVPYLDLVIVDARFCVTDARWRAHEHLHNFYGVHADWIYFENDPHQCLANVQARQDGRAVKGFITHMSKMYVIPPNSTVMPVWRGLSHVDTI